jgi:hypothetical protein
MKKKGGKKSGKKKGNQKKNGRGGGGSQKLPAGASPGFERLTSVITKAERIFVAGFGNMVTKSWEDARNRDDGALMVEIARRNMEQYGEKVENVQSTASLLFILGYSLLSSGRAEVFEEGLNCQREAFDLIRSEGERNTVELLYGVWPECLRNIILLNLNSSPEALKEEIDCIWDFIDLTRHAIDWEMGIVKEDPHFQKLMECVSENHYRTELQIGAELLSCESLLSFDIAPSLLAFKQRLEEIEADLKHEGWELDLVEKTKIRVLIFECNLLVMQGQADVALQSIESLVKAKVPEACRVHACIHLKEGQIDEAFESLETHYRSFRSRSGCNRDIIVDFEKIQGYVPEECKSRFNELIPHYPHVLWAAKLVGAVELTKEEKKKLRENLVAKPGGFCVNCDKELTKVYRCSRCNVATYCGSACQKEAWKEHKEICKKRE